MLPYLRNDAALRRNFFSRLKVLWFAGALLRESPSTTRRPGHVEGVVAQPGVPRDGITGFAER